MYPMDDPPIKPPRSMDEARDPWMRLHRGWMTLWGISFLTYISASFTYYPGSPQIFLPISCFLTCLLTFTSLDLEIQLFWLYITLILPEFLALLLFNISEPRNLAATNLAGALYTSPGNEAPTTSITVEQIQLFNQRAKITWYTQLEERNNTRKRTSASKKRNFIRQYIEGTIEKGLTKAAIKKRSQTKAVFYVDSERLYRNVNKLYSRPREVLSVPKLFNTITIIYNSLGYTGQDTTAKSILDQYFGVSKKEIIELLRYYTIYNRKYQSKSKGPLINIVTDRLFQRIQIDLIDIRHNPDREFYQILYIEDHFSKYHILYALKDKEAITITRNIYYQITYFGISKFIQSDNGTKFQGACSDLL